MGVGYDPGPSWADEEKRKRRFHGGGIFSGDVYDDSGKRIGRMESDCFIATACSRAMGLSDDCPELEFLRGFRDNYLKNLLGGQLLIWLYYRIGPRIVDAIDRCKDSKKIYSGLYEQLVLKSQELIQQGKKNEALRNGLNIVSKLMLKYLP